MFIIVGAEKKIKMVTVVTLPKKEIFPRKLLGIVYSHENNQIFKFQFVVLLDGYAGAAAPKGSPCQGSCQKCRKTAFLTEG